MKDGFGNIIDPEVGYARGEIIRSSFEEKLKYLHAVELIQQRIREKGEDSLYIFTGNMRYNQLLPSDIGIMSEEWIGPSLYADELKEVGLKHVSGNPETDDVAICNRTSAGNISAAMALGGPDKTVISFAPSNKPHPSVPRGARMAGAKLISVATPEELEAVEVSPNGGVCMITSVTSELLYLTDDELRRGAEIAKAKGLYVVVDDAYGARVRPILLHMTPALKLGADVVITNNDKAGLNGPRAGIVAGNRELVMKISAKASECGLEARAPLSLAVYRSLSHFQPKDLEEEAAVGAAIYEELVPVAGKDYVKKSLLGPEVSAEAVLTLAMKLNGKDPSEAKIVPAEATAALGMELLQRAGIVTTNACGMPGARISVRFKTNGEVSRKLGGPKVVVDAFMEGCKAVGAYADDLETARKKILG